MKHECQFCGHDFASEPQETHHCDPRKVRARAIREYTREDYERERKQA
jgi:hypothetical protein